MAFPRYTEGCRSLEGDNSQHVQTYGHAYPEVHVADHARVQLGDNHNHYYPSLQTVQSTIQVRQKILDALLYSLSFTGLGLREQRVGQAIASTCDWVAEHAGYLAWTNDELMQEHHGTLWMKGKPGTGKSTTLKYMMEKLEQNRPTDLLVSYFFNARATTDLEKSTLGMYRAIVHQLVSNAPQLKKSFLTQFARKVSFRWDNSQAAIVSEWSALELQDFLTKMAKSTLDFHACIFIDALNEGENQQDIRLMVAFLEDLAQHALAAQNTIRICLSSRHYPHITIKKGISLILEQELGHQDDISKYIRSKLAVQEESVAASLQSTIQQKSSQIFLWVKIVVGILNDMYDAGAAPGELTEHLEKLPDELHGLFKNILLRDKASIRSTVLLFQCVLFACRPLAQLELYHAIKLGTGDVSALQHAASSRSVKRFLIQCSRGLVEVVAEDDMDWVKSFEPNEAGYRKARIERKIYGAVQFIHESVRDFLLKREELVQLSSDLAGIIEGLSHDAIKKCCVAQLDRLPLVSRQGVLDLPWPSSLRARHVLDRAAFMWDSFPLLNYAVMFLFEHARLAHERNVGQQELLAICEENRNNVLTKWLLVYELRTSSVYPLKDFVNLAKCHTPYRTAGLHLDLHDWVKRAHSCRLVFE